VALVSLLGIAHLSTRDVTEPSMPKRLATVFIQREGVTHTARSPSLESLFTMKASSLRRVTQTFSKPARAYREICV